MRTETFVRAVELPVSAERAFSWHERPGAFQRLLPPWERVSIEHQDPGLADGARVVVSTRVGPLRQRWEVRHEGYEPGRRFRDVQVTGPFARWEHTHSFAPVDAGSSRLEERIEYALPVGRRFVRRKLERLFNYRHAVTRGDLEAHGDGEPLRILVSGSSGLLGSRLLPFLTTGGHEVVRLVRAGGPVGIPWDPASGRLDPGLLAGFDAVVHLAGENIAGGRWTESRRARILRSRVDGTRLLAEALASATGGPRVLLCASATGVYGDRGAEELDEASAPGAGFLADVVRAWEQATGAAESAGVRVVKLRLGMVLDPAGGALGKTLPLFRAGLGGRLGDGRQRWSWIASDDVLGAILLALRRDDLSGPVNVVSPEPCTNAEFTRVLAGVLRRPALFPAPRFALRTALGSMADELLLSGAVVRPRRMEECGYRFRHTRLEGALRHMLGRRA